MGLRDAVSALFGVQNSPTQVEWLGPTFRSMVLGLTPEELYKTQPHLRIVLSFVARNIAHLGLKAYTRTSDTNRERLTDDPLALLLKRPNPTQTMFEVLEGLASDLGLYDIAYLYVAKTNRMKSGWVLQPIPPAWIVKQSGGTFFAPGNFTIQNPDGTQTELPAEDMLVFHGWNPDDPKRGTSPVQTLKQVLAEQVQAWSYREQVWQRGGRVGAFLTRPKDSSWSDTARERFARDWKERWTGMDGAKAGGTPILEDGMELKRLGFSAREDEWAEVSKLALSTVAAVYHVNPVMVGILDNANFSNTKEFRKMLYSETLGPQLARIEARLNTFLVPRVSDDPDAYVEFNIEEKLQGDFEEQAVILSSSTGAPWMTRNEARALRNLPEIDGGDDLVVPLNVIAGGLASPRDTAPKDIGELVVVRPRALKAGRARSIKSADIDPTEYEAAAAAVLKRFFKRQRESLKATLERKAAGDPDWWDGDRWDSELSDDLFKLAVTTATQIGREQAKALGFDSSDYDEARTLKFLRAVADSRAGAVNSTTRDQIKDAIASDDESVDDVFDEAEDTRTSSGATALVAALAGFAVAEVGAQLLGQEATKTWVTGANPRSSHAEMDGETVGIDDVFSNGMKWPGDSAGGADEVAGCNCGLEIQF